MARGWRRARDAPARARRAVVHAPACPRWHTRGVRRFESPSLVTCPTDRDDLAVFSCQLATADDVSPLVHGTAPTPAGGALATGVRPPGDGDDDALALGASAPGLTAPRARIASRARPSRVLSLAPRRRHRESAPRRLRAPRPDSRSAAASPRVLSRARFPMEMTTTGVPPSTARPPSASPPLGSAARRRRGRSSAASQPPSPSSSRSPSPPTTKPPTSAADGTATSRTWATITPAPPRLPAG